MKRVYAICMALCLAASAFSQASKYFPDWAVSTWRYRDVSLDSMSQQVDSTRSTRFLEFTGTVPQGGYLAKQMRERVFQMGSFSEWDTTYSAFDGNNAFLYQSPIVLQDTSFLSGFIDVNSYLIRFKGWYSPYQFGQSYYYPYTVFKFDTTLGVDSLGLDIVLRFQVTGQRLPETPVTVPRATYPSSSPFLITYQLGFLGDLPVVGRQFIPMLTIQDSIWIARHDWIVKIHRPPSKIDLASFGIPDVPVMNIPGYLSELETATILTGVAEEPLQTQPLGFLLLEAYPNPFNPSTVMRFNLPSTGEVSLRVYDLMGREVTTLENGVLTEGAHEVRWTPTGIASGMYIARLQHGGKTLSRSLSLIK